MDMPFGAREDAMFTSAHPNAAKGPGKEGVPVGSSPSHAAGASAWAGAMATATPGISPFSSEADADRPAAVPLRAGVGRADPGRAADELPGLG